MRYSKWCFFYPGWWKWPCLCSPNGKFHSQSWSHAGPLSWNICYSIKLIYFADDLFLQELQSFTVTFRSEEVIITRTILWWLRLKVRGGSFLISCSVQEEKKHNFVTDSARSVSQWVEVPTQTWRNREWCLKLQALRESSYTQRREKLILLQVFHELMNSSIHIQFCSHPDMTCFQIKLRNKTGVDPLLVSPSRHQLSHCLM